MVWKYWSVREIQDELGSYDSKLLSKLEVIIPSISGNDYDPTELYRKGNLVKVLEAFAPSDYFQKKKNMRKVMNKIPPDVLEALSMQLGIGINSIDFNHRVESIVSKGWKDIEFSKKFLFYFNLPHHFLPPEKNELSASEELFPPTKGEPILIDSAYKPLKDFQFQVFLNSLENISIPRSRFIIQMPTGSGKTRTAMEFITRFINEAESPIIVIWLAHSEELCEQSYQCFKEVWLHVARKKLISCRVWGKNQFPPSINRPMFIVGGFQKLYSLYKNDPDCFDTITNRVGLLVIDEAHKSTAPTFKEIALALCGDNTKIIGLSATPGRANEEETKELSDFYFQKKVDISTGGLISVIEMLKRKRILSNIDFKPLITNIDYKMSDKELSALELDLDFPKGFLEKIGKDNIRNIEIVKNLLKESENNQKILFFGCSINHSKFITALLIYFGINAVHIDGSTGKTRRRDALKNFKNGDIQVLCNYGVLSTGFDAPNTNVVFIARPTNSVVLYSQMIGRGLRGPAIGGTEDCKIIDVIDNIIGYGDQEKVYEYFGDYWN